MSLPPTDLEICASENVRITYLSVNLRKVLVENIYGKLIILQNLLVVFG